MKIENRDINNKNNKDAYNFINDYVFVYIVYIFISVILLYIVILSNINFISKYFRFRLLNYLDLFPRQTGFSTRKM